MIPGVYPCSKGKISYREKPFIFHCYIPQRTYEAAAWKPGQLGSDEYLFVFDNDSSRVVRYKKSKGIEILVLILDVKRTTEFFKNEDQ